MAIHTVIGQAATGDDFYPREEVIEKLWDKIESGHHILITAPRRVGKTSILKFIQDNPKADFEPIYIITESVNNGNEFFRKVFKELIKLLSGSRVIKTQLSRLIKSNRITSISIEGFTIEGKQFDYFDELLYVIDHLDLEGRKLVFIIDEFAQTVENIIDDEDIKSAKGFLSKCREIRHKDGVKDKLLFIYAGSIGLESIVSRINAIHSINDLYPFDIPPFSPGDARELINKLTKNAGWRFNSGFFDHLFNSIGWLLPYYLQIVVDEIDKIGNVDVNEIDETVIDVAIENAIKQRIYFEHWLIRLRKAYKGNGFKFAKELLNVTSENGQISNNEISDLAEKYDIAEDFLDIVNALKHDGYIDTPADSKIFRFNSPLLRVWWDRNVNF